MSNRTTSQSAERTEPKQKEWKIDDNVNVNRQKMWFLEEKG